MKRFIWMSHDLGINGDYEGIYRWLDNNGAMECGDSVAGLKYEYKGDFITSLKKDLGKSVELGKKDRIYVAYYDKKENKLKGKFIFGKRKRAPWKGVAEEFEEEDEIAV